MATDDDILRNFFCTGGETLWRRHSPCPSCHGNEKIKCVFGSKCAFPVDSTGKPGEIFHGMKRMLSSSRKEQYTQTIDTLLDFKSYIKKHGITVKTILCNRSHDTSYDIPCGNNGFAHSIEELIDAYHNPIIMKYFKSNLKYIGDGNYFIPHESIQCKSCKQSNRFQMMCRIYTHHKDGRLQTPACSMFCLVCQKQSYYSLYGT